jgi:hypothetical protein
MKSMKKYSNGTALLVLSVLFALVSCNDTWEKYYYGGVASKSNLTLYKYIKSQDDLTTFSTMLEISGYDSILNAPQTYSVWVPTNEALQNIDLTDNALVTNTVRNHIARFLYPTSGVTNEVITLLNHKYVFFKNEGSDYTYGNQRLISERSNIGTANGIIHVIDGCYSFKPNFWQFINTNPGLDSLKNFFNSQTTYIFDLANSVEIGTNSLGQSIYDSVMIFSNPLLDKYGALNNEDSLYTAILPNNTAWSKIYETIKSKYKTYSIDGTGSQNSIAKTAIIQNLIYRDSISSPYSFTSLTSTSGNRFENPSYLFDNSEKHLLSNGYAFVTDSFRFRAEDTYQQKIVVEAENSSYGRSVISASLYSRSALGTPFSSLVSEDNYVLINPTTPKIENTAVKFPIPNTLSGTYNIYCVFVPTNIVSTTTTSTKVYKVNYTLHYLNSNGVKDSAVVTSTNTLDPAKSAVAGAFLTNPSVITKQFVTQFTFPYCNLYDPKTSTTSSITTKLRVQNAAVAAECTKTGPYDSSLRIDYVILEPVVK